MVAQLMDYIKLEKHKHKDYVFISIVKTEYNK